MSYQPHFVLGYHGCRKTHGMDVLNADTALHLHKSNNKYDWLGSGIYFWLNDPDRALSWAIEQQKTKKDPTYEPFAVGAIIDLGNCLNLSEKKNLDLLKSSYDLLKIQLQKDVKQLPQNKSVENGVPLFRELDCLVINYLCSLFENENGTKYDTVMGYFEEGTPIYPGTNIKKKITFRFASET